MDDLGSARALGALEYPSSGTEKSSTAGMVAAQTRPPGGLAVFRASKAEEILEIREIRDIAHEFHSESRYAHLPFSEKKFIRFFTKAISSPENTLALYVQHNGNTVGLINAGAGDYYLGKGGRMATVYVMYVSRSIRNTFLGGKIGLRLIRMVGDWARSQKAEELRIHSTSGIDPERTDKLLRGLGLKTYGGNYVGLIV